VKFRLREIGRIFFHKNEQFQALDNVLLLDLRFPGGLYFFICDNTEQIDPSKQIFLFANGIAGRLGFKEVCTKPSERHIRNFCSCYFQISSLRHLEEESREAGQQLEEVVARGEALLTQIQAALSDIAQSQLDMQHLQATTGASLNGALDGNNTVGNNASGSSPN